jgi:eukaryotic-like serine/threonine-protein kinase
MRLGIKQVSLIILAVAFWLFNISVWLSVMASVLAWFISESSITGVQLGPTVIDFPQIKAYLQNTKVSFSPIYEFLGLLATAITMPLAKRLWIKATSIPIESEKSKVPTAEKLIRDREELIRTVNKNWIDGVLKKSLYHSLLFDLGMETAPTAIHRKTDLIVQMYDEKKYLFPKERQIAALFDSSGGWLLILGDPGAGKTTTLLELTKELLARAEADTSKPIPVVFSLSSWDDDEMTLLEWAENELCDKYGVPIETAHYWVQEEGVTLMLDGLDEVKNTQRNNCLVAINDFRQEWPRTKFVVSSRLNEYKELAEKLIANTAIILMPLSPLQIENFLVSIGNTGEILRTVLHNEPELWDLARTPLLLNVMAMSTPELVGEEFASSATDLSTKDRVLYAYVREMFRRRLSLPNPDPFDRRATTNHLVWLAGQMNLHNFSFFHIASITHFSIRNNYAYLLKRSVKWFLSFIFVVAALVLLVLMPTAPIPYNLAIIKNNSTFSNASMSIDITPYLGMSVGIIFVIFVVFAAVSLVRKSWYSSVFPRSGAYPPPFKSDLLDFLRSFFAWGDFVEFYRSAEHRQLLLKIMAATAVSLLVYIFLVSWAAVLPFTASGLTLVQLALMFIALMVSIYLWLWSFSDLLHRLLLALESSFPWHYEQFLEYCVELKFMYRVGPSYVFIHRMVLEHFASFAVIRDRKDRKRLNGTRTG